MFTVLTYIILVLVCHLEEYDGRLQQGVQKDNVPTLAAP